VDAFPQPRLPCHYAVAHDGLLVVEKWRGAVTHEGVLNHVATQVKDSRIADGARVLADLTLCSFPPVASNQVAEVSKARWDGGKAAIRKAALLTTRVDNYDLAKRFAAACATFGLEVQVFARLNDACAWLPADASQVDQLLDQL